MEERETIDRVKERKEKKQTDKRKRKVGSPFSLMPLVSLPV